MSLIHVICGPTASGKSALAVDLAGDCNGVIINADSMQIYDALPILTARPAPEDTARAPHMLYGILPAHQKCSAQAWRTLAITAIEEVLAAGRVPVLVGGTGLYLKALMSGLSEMPDIPPGIRQMAVDRQKNMGNPAFHADLALRDPVMAARLNPNDTQRLIRAWEVMEATGQSLAEWQSAEAKGPPAHWRFRVLIKSPARDDLHRRCDMRFDQMIADGALDEVRDFATLIDERKIPADAAIAHALGFRILAQHIRGLISLDEAARQAKAETRQYAKRQETWFRHQIIPQPHIELAGRVP